MALTKISRGLLSTGISDSSDATAITIDSSERVGIGTTSPSAPLTVSTTGSGDAVIIESTEAGSSNAPDLVLHRNSASPADDDSLGIIRFRGENDASEAIDLINIFGQVTDVSDGSEDSTLYFKTYTDGAEQSPLTLVGANVGIGTSSPNRNIHINGTGDVSLGITNANTGTSASDGFNITVESPTPDVVIRQRENNNMRFLTNNTERMRIDSSGTLIVNRTDKPNVGEAVAVSREGVAIAAGTDSGEYRLMYGNNSSNMILYFSNGSNQAQLTSAGVWQDASDLAYKKDIVDIHYGLDTVKKLKPRTYKMKTDDEQQIGFIAQELELDIPEVVGGEDGNKGVSYGQLTAVLTKAIQEQQTQIEAMQLEIDNLKKS